ncbi:unnamed protein product [Ceutorhynchus assimilis]|uniref:Regulator of microtubule dynamics protein 1 n=1 Tax=Ceutorhynchus assimilis TaxID=467358 RepID=A0A9N9MQ05_9CUCU|nr:unnamed protein product [Ceutorhynchus assimilis]
MPALHQNLNAFLGAAVLGVIGAAGMFLVEHYRQERMRNAMAKDLARLEREMAKIKLDLQQLQAQKSERPIRPKRTHKSNTKKANSIISNTTDDYLSAANLDSSDLEFYDVTDEENTEPENGSPSDLDLILNHLDVKLNTGTIEDIEEALHTLEDLCLENPGNFELLYRIGKAHHKIADASDDKDFVNLRLTKGIEACESALSIAPENSEVHKWFAVLIGSKSDLVSIQERIKYGHTFKKHVDIAISINPGDYSLHHMLGRFDFEVAGLKWYEKKVASAFFGEPPTATYEEACSHLLAAEKLAPFEWKDNKLMIAKCKIAMGEYEEAVGWLEKAINSHGTSLDEKVDIEINTLLEKYR